MTTLQSHPVKASLIVPSMPAVESDLIQGRLLQKQLKQCEVQLIEINKSLEKAELISDDYYILQSQKIALYHRIYDIKEQL